MLRNSKLSLQAVVSQPTRIYDRLIVLKEPSTRGNFLSPKDR